MSLSWLFDSPMQLECSFASSVTHQVLSKEVYWFFPLLGSWIIVSYFEFWSLRCSIFIAQLYWTYHILEVMTAVGLCVSFQIVRSFCTASVDRWLCKSCEQKNDTRRPNTNTRNMNWKVTECAREFFNVGRPTRKHQRRTYSIQRFEIVASNRITKQQHSLQNFVYYVIDKYAHFQKNLYGQIKFKRNFSNI